MEVHRQLSVLSLGKHRTVDRVGDIGIPDALELSGEKNSLVPEIMGPPHFLYGRCRVPEWQHHDRNQALGVSRGKLGEEVVVGPDTIERKLKAQLPDEGVTVEPDEIWIEHLRSDPELVKPANPCFGIEAGGISFVEVRGMRRERLVPSGDGILSNSGEKHVTNLPSEFSTLLVPL